ncbi:hypothetical protein PORCAN_621 [Porphyromonas crevioricanis JCM 13913]|nr:hypothetical protein PORCAN_621 [Porphyromonas crevioricanis JCM 13913]
MEKMPPVSQSGKNIVAFEIEGFDKPFYVNKWGQFWGFPIPREASVVLNYSEKDDSYFLYIYSSKMGGDGPVRKFSLCFEFHKEENSFVIDNDKIAVSFYDRALPRYIGRNVTRNGGEIFVDKLDLDVPAIAGRFEISVEPATTIVIPPKRLVVDSVVPPGSFSVDQEEPKPLVLKGFFDFKAPILQFNRHEYKPENEQK